MGLFDFLRSPVGGTIQLVLSMAEWNVPLLLLVAQPFLAVRLSARSRVYTPP
jgi:hypothetical protein